MDRSRELNRIARGAKNIEGSKSETEFKSLMDSNKKFLSGFASNVDQLLLNMDEQAKETNPNPNPNPNPNLNLNLKPLP